MVIVLILGTIIDSASIMLIMVPLFIAAIKSFEIDLVWFGVVTVIATEVGLLTPPFGLAVFVVHSTLARSDISLKDIFVGSAPFALATVQREMGERDVEGSVASSQRFEDHHVARVGARVDEVERVEDEEHVGHRAQVTTPASRPRGGCARSSASPRSRNLG